MITFTICLKNYRPLWTSSIQIFSKMNTPIAVTNKNPLNIRFSPMNDWRGQTGSRKGFCEFDSFMNGARAAMVLLCNYVRKGYDTVPEIIARWAPASENNTKSYIRTVVSGLSYQWYDTFDGASDAAVRSRRLDSYHALADLAWQMAFVEIGRWTTKHFSDMEDLKKLFHTIADTEKLPLLKK